MRRQFDQENNRLNYSHLLHPKPGYALSFAVGMTYSLDLEALLSVPLSFGMFEDIDSVNGMNPYAVLEAVRCSSDRLAVFCNVDGIKLPQNIRAVFALLENSIFPVSLGEGCNFHPKLWIVRYSNEDGPDMIKVIVLSRNLTFDRSMDIAVEMEGVIGDEESGKHKPLSDLMLVLAKRSNVSKDKRKQIRELAGDLLRVPRFEIDNQYEDYNFIPVAQKWGFETGISRIFKNTYHLIVVSPFLSTTVVKQITEGRQTTALITRIGSVTPEIFKRFQQVYVPVDGLENNNLLEEEDYGEKRDLHAKIIFAGKNTGDYLYLGSLNTTANAFYRNVEFMLELKFKPYKTSFQNVLDDLVPEKNSAFKQLESVEEDAVSIEEEEHMTGFFDAIHVIKNAEVVPDKDGKGYSIVIHASHPQKPAAIRPMFWTPRRGIKADGLDLEETVIFQGMAVKELSEFYVIGRGGAYCVAKIPTKNIPKERDDAIFKDIIKGKNGFLAYMLFLLSDDYAAASMEMGEFQKILDMADGKSGYKISPAIYEKLLRTAAFEPKKLDAVVDVMKRLDKESVDDNFRQIVSMFKQAAALNAKRRKRR